MKKIAILPTLLTLGNAVCGFASIAFATRITPESDRALYISAVLICAAMLFDALDGYAARLSKTASDFGGQLDSLCDAISFGAAPAFLLLRLGQDWEMPVMQQSITVIAILYMVCAVLRLARFNVDNSPDAASHKRFKGLPSPAAAGCVASLAILRSGMAHSGIRFEAPVVYDLVKVLAPLGTLVVALLMVSRLSYPHLTKQLLRGRKHFGHLIQIILAVCVLALLGELSLLVVFWGYALSIAMRYVALRGLRSQRLPAPAGLDDGLRR